LNLLAHAVLSPDRELVRVGNVVADFIHRNETTGLPKDIQTGIGLHRRIDSFTDNHLAVANSKSKMIAFKRFANPLIDVFYDHFLTKHWDNPIPIREFTHQLYRSVQTAHPLLPENCVRISKRMIEDDWLNLYDTFEGLAINLERMERRIEFRAGRKVDLVSSLQILEVRYDEFETDFLEFWPQLVGHAS
jgi:acyl carrier protein phosphodiesterase